MNTTRLAKMYDTLTPRERLPLLIAAAIREDEAEQTRLMNAAPVVRFQVPDYFGIAQALQEVAHLHMLTLLARAAEFTHARHAASSEPDPECERLFEALMLGYLFRVNLEGWRLFCAGLQIDPEALLKMRPGCSEILRADKATEKAAFLPEGANAYARAKCGDDAAAPTADDVAALLRESFGRRAEWWG